MDILMFLFIFSLPNMKTVQIIFTSVKYLQIKQGFNCSIVVMLDNYSFMFM